MGFKKLFNKAMLKPASRAALGGGIGGLAYGLAVSEISWLSSGTGYTPLLKQVGAAAVAGVVGASLLYSKQRDAAMGLVGAMGAIAGVKLYNHFASKDLSLAMPSASSYVQFEPGTDFRSLQSARVYEGQDLPANVGRGLSRVRVSEGAMNNPLMSFVS